MPRLRLFRVLEEEAVPKERTRPTFFPPGVFFRRSPLQLPCHAGTDIKLTHGPPADLGVALCCISGGIQIDRCLPALDSVSARHSIVGVC